MEFDPEASRTEEEGSARMTRYMVVIERGDTSRGAHVPDLPGCVAVGKTREEVVDLIREAITLQIEELRRELPVPKPTSEGEFVDVEAA
jgi:predicted RNase H-like HicB family nuclease